MKEGRDGRDNRLVAEGRRARERLRQQAKARHSRWTVTERGGRGRRRVLESGPEADKGGCRSVASALHVIISLRRR